MNKRLSRIKYILWETYPNVFDFDIVELSNDIMKLNALVRFRMSPLGIIKTMRIQVDSEGYTMSEVKKLKEIEK